MLVFFASTMDSNYRFSFSEPFLLHRRKVFSGFSLGLGASLLLCSLFFLSNSLRVPKNSLFLPLFNTSGSNSSFASPPLSFNSSHSSQINASEISSVVVSRTSEVNVSSVELVSDKKNSSFITNLGDNVINIDASLYNGNISVNGMHGGHQMEKMKGGLYEDCDIFDGKWVRDDSKPYYPLGSCPFIDRDFDCHINGRPDAEYVKWKWQPNKCHIPRYD